MSTVIAETEKPAEGQPEAPTCSKVRTITIGGKEYTLDFTFRRLADAEEFFSKRGHRDCNILFALSPATLNVHRLQALIACAAHTNHPELSYAEAVALVNNDSLYPLLNLYYDVVLPSEADLQPGTSQNLAAAVDARIQVSVPAIVNAVTSAQNKRSRRSVGTER